jgi:hypothetical protein
VPFELPRLQRLEPPVEHPRNGQRLVRRDLAGGHRQQRRVERRHRVAGARRLRQVEGDRPAARERARAEQAEEEARRDGIAGRGLVDDGARHHHLLALGERFADERRAVARARPLAGGVARLAGEKAPAGVAGGSG